MCYVSVMFLVVEFFRSPFSIVNVILVLKAVFVKNICKSCVNVDSAVE